MEDKMKLTDKDLGILYCTLDIEIDSIKKDIKKSNGKWKRIYEEWLKERKVLQDKISEEQRRRKE